MVAQNAFCLFKIPLNDAFLKGTVEIKEFRFYCKLPLAIHSHWSISIVFFSSHLLPCIYLPSLIICYSSRITFTLDKMISVLFFNSVILFETQWPAFCNFSANVLDIKVHLKNCVMTIGNGLFTRSTWQWRHFHVSAKALMLKFVTFDIVWYWV